MHIISPLPSLLNKYVHFTPFIVTLTLLSFEGYSRKSTPLYLTHIEIALDKCLQNQLLDI
jgi:hypothetical protein